MAQQSAVVVIPVLSEAAHICAILDGFLEEPEVSEIWVYDGGSTDGTAAIVQNYAQRYQRVSLFCNPGRLQARAVNLAAQRAARNGVDVLIRADAHARYPQGFVKGLLETLRTTDADSVVVPLVANGQSGWQGAAADLQRSFLGNGGAAHRAGVKSGWVDHGHHAVMRLDRFLALEGYDPRFAANEDVEYDKRLLAEGGQIYLENRWPVEYIPRATPVSLWKQMQRNGWYRVQTALKHNEALGLRQQLPVIATLLLTLSLILGVLTSPVAFLPAAAYATLVLGLSTQAANRKTPLRILNIACLAVLSHTGFGFGAISALVKWTTARTFGHGKVA